MAYRIRRATPQDLSLLFRLEADCFSDPWSEGALASHLGSGSGLSFLAVGEDGTPYGYLLGLSLLAEGELLRVGVLPAHRRCGAGRALTATLLTTLREGGAEACFLEVREGNAAAQALYAAHGFTVVGRRKQYYKNPSEDALVMSCRL
ncbi:MAG: ribosomal protein S18-alanine N-acetyltransferase [Clostridia bacterium]|nr:ribosomal protein S18-alanine N-acetyltransferase [Clostridia bacterium]